MQLNVTVLPILGVLILYSLFSQFSSNLSGGSSSSSQAAAVTPSNGKPASGADASKCVFSSLGYTNNCEQTIEIDLHALSGSGGKFCTGEGLHTLYPHQKLDVSPDCVSFINLRGATYR